MNAEREINAALKGEGCLGKAAPDEPVFVLRAQDQFAPSLVNTWAHQLKWNATTDAQRAKAAEAMRLAEEMVAWQLAHGSKVPD